MPPQKPTRPKRSSIVSEEERTWVEFYRRIRTDAALATEVLTQLEADPEMKRSHLALYLSCKETLRRENARLARNQRIGQAVRLLASWLFVKPRQTFRTIGSNGRDIAIEMLPSAQPPFWPDLPGMGASPRRHAAATTGVSPSVRRSRKPRSDAPTAETPAAGVERADPASS